MGERKMDNKKRLILSTLEDLYGPCKQSRYFLLKDRKEEDVRSEIINKLIYSNIIDRNDNRIDLYLVITQIHSDVFIQI